MSTKLQRYRINNCADIADDKGGYCDADDVTELEAINESLVKALEDTLKLACGLIDDDCSWDAEEDDTIIAARKALAGARGES